MTLKAIIFDVDGTLAETEDLHRTCFNEAFAAQGLPWTWGVALYGSLIGVGGGGERIRHYIDTTHPELAERLDVAALASSLHKDKSRRYAEQVGRKALTPRPGVLRLIREAHAAGLKLACATSSQRTAVDALFDLILGPEMRSWFEVMGCGGDVTHKKPAPDIYQHVMTRMGVTPSDCIAIEDSNVGLTSGLAAGLVTLVTISTYSRNDSFSGAAAVLSDLGEPEKPLSVERGDAFGHGWVTVDALRRWHETAHMKLREPSLGA